MSALQPPENATYDIVIVGGAIMGRFRGLVLVG